MKLAGQTAKVELFILEERRPVASQQEVLVYMSTVIPMQVHGCHMIVLLIDFGDPRLMWTIDWPRYLTDSQSGPG